MIMKKNFEIWKYKYKELKSRFLKSYYKVEGRYKYPLIYSLNKLFRFLEISLVALVLLLILSYSLDLFEFSLFNNLMTRLPTLSPDLNKQFIFSQLSITFIILSLFSVITNLKKEKVLGTSVYKIAFAKSLLGNIILISITMFSLLFINFSFFIIDSSSSKILFLFLFSLIILTLLIIRTILFTNSQRLSINKIASLYYWENRKRILRQPKSIDRIDKKPEYLSNLKEDTLEKILRKDVEYRLNLHVFERITNLSLINYKYKVQENYTEIINYPDIITDWAECIQELIRKELFFDALSQYNLMLRTFISNETYISSFQINDILRHIFVGLSSHESKVVFEQNKELLLDAMYLTMKYGYYKINNDFSYTRLGKLKNMVYLPPLYSDFLNDYYTLIDKNNRLNDFEKSKQIIEFFESLRMNSFDITTPFHNNFRKVKYNQLRFESNSYSYDGDLCLVGIPLSKLLILLMQDNKRRMVLYFLTNFNNNSIYFACLIVASKLTSLYLDQLKALNNEKNINEISKYLNLVLSKLITWDNYKIKYNSYILNKIESDMNNNLYSYFFFNRRDCESLNIVKQVLMMKKQKIDVNIISFSDKNLESIANNFSGVEPNMLEKALNEEQKISQEKYGVLINII